jgi:hypothetical protein
LNDLPIKGSLHELRKKAKISKTSKFDNVARIPTRDPQDFTVVDEEWFELRHKPKKGFQEWKV